MPGDEGPVPARSPDGSLPDLFDVVDALHSSYPIVCVVDLDGIDRNRPQLDYLQEMARDLDIWVDAGVPTGEQAIDILVTGARRVILGTAYLESRQELARAWKLSQDVMVDVEIRNGSVAAQDPNWSGSNPETVALDARTVGPTEVIMSFRPGSVDWELASRLGQSGPTWVSGTFGAEDASHLGPSGLRGGIFHLDQGSELWKSRTKPREGDTRSAAPRDNRSNRRRDDEA
ncbi:MAG TPA: HisA/HisF-related TIM barrel protein [Thermoplasmata archaeon]|nr:HisA/HisF-related TIM barrel protein [Thermoplasmata archaeon]